MKDLKQNTNLDRPTFIIRTKSLRDILADLRKAELWLTIAAVAAFLASAFFVVKYFVGGDLTPESWSSEQWMNALLGLGITAVITSAQAFLYASGYKGHAAVIATFVVVFFGLFSEISQSMEREDATVRHRSENSAVFQAALNSIGTVAGTANAMSPEQKQLADARAGLNYWEGLKAQKNAVHQSVKYSHRTIDRNITDFRQQIDSLSRQVGMQDQNRSSLLAGAINQAKALEYDEDKHYAMIRLIRNLLGVTGLWASFLFSVIIIGTFEYAFHFVGAYVADHKRALLLLGRDANGSRILSAVHEAPQPAGGPPIPEDHGNLLRDSSLDWLTPECQQQVPSVGLEEVPRATERTGVSSAAGSPVAAGPESHEDGAGIGPEMARVHDLTQKRFYKIIYTDIRNSILNEEIRPTVRPVTEAVTGIIREKGQAMGINPAQVGKPERQRIAQTILEQLERESVLLLNQEGGIGKAKYVLAPRFMRSAQSTHAAL
ncbi:MAG: hypothetical protein KDI44_05165 [Thiothrix sp.]|nr:hypothetical protein [Thiothrix sp.]HPQ94926.1 hypothetical protein [Thiolinea sp.]